VAICPGLAVTLVDYRKKSTEGVVVSIPYEFHQAAIKEGDLVTVRDTLGDELGRVPVLKVRSPKFADHALLVKVKAPPEIAKRIAGIQVQAPWATESLEEHIERIDDDDVVCRCERVTAGEIRKLIRQGVRDLNHLKALTRAGMGACGAKTCPSLIARIFREEGVPSQQITPFTQRPLIMEVPLGAFAGVATGEGPKRDAAPASVGTLEGGV
jgi:bacterioferritin-associated ferredoxin